MKKWTALLLALAMTLSLAACGSSGNQENASDMSASASGSAAEETPAPTDTETPAAAPAEDPAESGTSATGDPGSVLIAYFSWSGNTEQVAQIIRGETGGDLFEIAPATPYTDDYNELLDIAQQEQADSARPELAGQVEDWDRYDTVFVGYPTGGTMRPWRSIPSWSPMTGAARRWSPSTPAPAAALAGACPGWRRAPLGLRCWRGSPSPSVPLGTRRAK